jgi:hypothetical protein
MAAGVLWIGDGALLWAPTERWRRFGARRFELGIDSLSEVEATHCTGQSFGLVIRGPDRLEVWLWVRGESAVLVDALKASVNRRGFPGGSDS